jgi:hypothetical protein
MIASAVVWSNPNIRHVEDTLPDAASPAPISERESQSSQEKEGALTPEPTTAS